MEHITFKEIFASLAYHSAEYTLIKTFIWLLIAVISTYVFYFIFSKVLYNSKKSKQKIKTDTRLPLALLWSVVSFMILFSILITVLLYYANFNSINWGNHELYLVFFNNQTLSLFPYLICFLAVIIYYYFKRQKFKNNIKTI
jgi:uncharacterized membrane protein